MGLLPWLANWYASFDFSNVLGFPHENPRPIPGLYGHNDSIILHVSYFIEFNLSIDIVHEDTMMNFFP
jgi:hypothetical protein